MEESAATWERSDVLPRWLILWRSFSHRSATPLRKTNKLKWNILWGLSKTIRGSRARIISKLVKRVSIWRLMDRRCTSRERKVNLERSILIRWLIYQWEKIWLGNIFKVRQVHISWIIQRRLVFRKRKDSVLKRLKLLRTVAQWTDEWIWII